MRSIIIATLLILISPAAPVAANTASVASFEVWADGFHIGQLSARYKAKASGYTITVKGKAAGILGFLLRASYDGISKGAFVANGHMQPDVFYARTSRIFKKRVQRVDYRNGLPIKVAIAPKRDLTEMSDPSLVTSARLDPLSFFALFMQDRRNGCPASADLYDGRRLTHVTLAPTPPAAAKDAQNRLSCEGSYQITRGPDHSILPGIRSFPVRFDYTRAKGQRLFRLDRIEVTSGANHVVLTRNAITTTATN